MCFVLDPKQGFGPLYGYAYFLPIPKNITPIKQEILNFIWKEG